MIKRVVCALAPAVATLGIAVTPSAAVTVSTVPNAANVAVTRLLAEYNKSGTPDGLFTTPTDPTAPTCKNTYHGGQCWWWSADTFMALITYAEEHSRTADATAIKGDLQNTYQVICGQGSCPAGPNKSGADPFQNTYYDDTGWWEQAWINAYKLTGNRPYVYLAEELWNYITAKGWNSACGGGVNQHSGTGNTEDSYANALYLRSSAWLYSITRIKQYMNGVPIPKTTHTKGGAFADALFIVHHLVNGPYDGVAPGTPGSEFMISDHPASGCKGGARTQMWLSAQGETVNAFSDMYAADKAFGGSDPGYYNNLADELARTVIGNKPGTHPGMIATVDAGGILSEPCQSKKWPADCALRPKTGGEAPFLIFKGIFERGIYCSNHNFSDSALTSFISKNATSIAGLNRFGFLWDSQGNTLINYATQTSVLDGLDAGIGGSFAMC